jgi:phosphatidylethanolamine-binding protein (PEBP) family uncharacterized protein
MSKLWKATPGALLLSTLTLIGCGGSGSGGSTMAQVLFRSSGIAGTAIPAKYTCDGKNISPPLEWGAVPASTGELALFILGFTETPKHGFRISDEWAVAGVNPKLHKIAAGQLPPGAFTGLVGHNKRRYSLCPKKGQNMKYQFELYGVPGSGVISRKFAGIPVLAALVHKGGPANAHGAFGFTYTRR